MLYAVLSWVAGRLLCPSLDSVVGNRAAEDDASKRSPEVFVENGINDLEESKESRTHKIGSDLSQTIFFFYYNNARVFEC